MPRSSSSHSSRPPSIGAPNYGQSSACSSETANRILALKLQLEMEQKRRMDVERALAEYSQGKPISIVGSGTKPLTEEALHALSAAASNASERSVRTVSTRSRTNAYGSQRQGSVQEPSSQRSSFAGKGDSTSRRSYSDAIGKPRGCTDNNLKPSDEVFPPLIHANERGREAHSGSYEKEKSKSVVNNSSTLPIPAPPARHHHTSDSHAVKSASAEAEYHNAARRSRSSGGGREAHVDGAGAERRLKSGSPKKSPLNLLREQLKEGKGQRKPPLPKEAKQTGSVSAASRFGKQRANDIDVYLARQRHEERMAALRAFEF